MSVSAALRANIGLIDPRTGKVWKAAKAGFCMLDTDPNPATGFCHALKESNYANNVGEVLITIPDRPSTDGVGPLAGTPHVKEEPEH